MGSAAGAPSRGPRPEARAVHRLPRPMPESPVTHPSSDAAGAALDERLVELETRLAFQEAALAELSDALAESRADTTRALLLLDRALHELRALRQGLGADGASADPALEPPPPHY